MNIKLNVIITGASKGIGLELCRLALTEGHHVLAVARTASQSTGLKKLTSDFSSNLISLDLDITATSSRQKILSEIKNWQSVDLLINNAGVLDESQSEEALLNSFRLNAIAPFLLTESLVPKLKQGSKPVVAQITSRMGSIAEVTSAGHCGYRASKAALNMFNKSLALENKWLTALVIHPGWVKTDMGGPEAPVTAFDSARGIWNVIDVAREKSQSGQFFDYRGRPIPW